MKKNRIRIGIILYLTVWILGGCGRNTGTLHSIEATEQDILQFTDTGEVLAEQETDAGKRQGILVFVCGAVVNPSVVELPEDSRVQDALLAAGGFGPEADREYVNLAARVTDGQQLFFPTGEEVLALQQEERRKQNALVNINTADEQELCTLPGIGESRAAEIVAYREKHGSFSTIEDLRRVDCISDNIYAKLADKIWVSD